MPQLISTAMAAKPSHLRSIPQFLLPFSSKSSHIRSMSISATQTMRNDTVKIPRVPKPTPFVPDVPTFLSLIGRNLSQHASKIPSWKALFSLSSLQMDELGIGPPRNRKYLLHWREKFRRGQYGPGGTLQHVKDGQAELQILEIPTVVKSLDPATPPTKFTRKVIVNVPPGGSAKDTKIPSTKIPGLKIKPGDIITGSYVLPAGGKNAKIVVKEGMWEVRRGRKIDGGERRRAEVQAKRRGEEKRAR